MCVDFSNLSSSSAWSILSPFLGICESSKSQALGEVETAESANLVKSWPFPYYKTIYAYTLWVP